MELLNSLNDDQLLFKPDGEKWQPLYYQFTCMARTQLVYARAAETGLMDFSMFGSAELPGKHDARTIESLKRFLEDSNVKWLAAIKGNQGTVEWQGTPSPISLHIMSLAEHERLHQGQLLSYFTLAKFELPESFKSNWALWIIDPTFMQQTISLTVSPFLYVKPTPWLYGSSHLPVYYSKI